MRFYDFFSNVGPFFGRSNDADCRIVKELVLERKLLFSEVVKGRLKEEKRNLADDGSNFIVKFLQLLQLLKVFAGESIIA